MLTAAWPSKELWIPLRNPAFGPGCGSTVVELCKICRQIFKAPAGSSSMGDPCPEQCRHFQQGFSNNSIDYDQDIYNQKRYVRPGLPKLFSQSSSSGNIPCPGCSFKIAWPSIPGRTKLVPLDQFSKDFFGDSLPRSLNLEFSLDQPDPDRRAAGSSS
jgi:hypothetical protein